jgi:hypothetical protein
MSEWKQKLPTETGFYWFRNLQREDEKEPRVVEVREYAGRLAIGNCTLDGWPKMEEGEWAGPLLPPR